MLLWGAVQVGGTRGLFTVVLSFVQIPPYFTLGVSVDSVSVWLLADGILTTVLLLGTVWALISPQRGLQDRIAGTYLVPR